MILNFLFKKGDPVDEISIQQYEEIFINHKKPSEIEKAYKQAWEARNREVENYWKRATYFWAFQVASFAGYFSVITSKGSSNIDSEISYMLICIGFITALSWVLSSKGSKFWQKQWDTHVDMLEDYVTGPLNKFVTGTKTYSATTQNEIVGYFVMTMWVFLVVKYWHDKVKFYFSFRASDINFDVVILSVTVLFFSCAMVNGAGKRTFGTAYKKFYKKKHIERINVQPTADE